MRICLIYTKAGWGLGLGYMASVLRNDGHNVSVIGMSQMKQGESDLHAFLKKGNFDLVGSGSVTSDVNEALRVLELAKKVARDNGGKTFTVYGGVHASLMEEKIFDEKTKNYLDAVVVGEGEYTLKEIVGRLEEGGNLKDVKGVIYLEDGTVRKNPIRPPIENLDELPFPARNLPLSGEHAVFGLITSRGCPYRCIFCCIRYHLGNRWRARSPENVIEEIELLVKKYNAKHFVFLDDSFNLDMDRAKEICRKILENDWKITWEAAQGIRLDRIDSELANLMKRSGCLFVGAGIETGDAEILKAIKKGLTKEKISQSVKLLREAGIITRGFFLIGNPGETVETLKKAVEFGKELKLQSLGFTFLMPYPKTEYKEWVEKHGKIIAHDWKKYDGHLHRPLVSLPTLSPSEAMEAWHWIIKEVARYNLSRYLAHPLAIIKSVRGKSRLAPIYHAYHVVFNLIPEALGVKKELVDFY